MVREPDLWFFSVTEEGGFVRRGHYVRSPTHTVHLHCIYPVSHPSTRRFLRHLNVLLSSSLIRRSGWVHSWNPMNPWSARPQRRTVSRQPSHGHLNTIPPAAFYSSLRHINEGYSTSSRVSTEMGDRSEASAWDAVDVQHCMAVRGSRRVSVANYQRLERTATAGILFGSGSVNSAGSKL